jgi:lipopolysaccharide transport system ATP-binding protein
LSDVITIENVGKKYKLGQVHNDLLSEKIGSALRSVYRFVRGNSLPSSPQTAGKVSADQFWALRDVNLTVHQGEVVGIIGRNGAGKSTLLKILSRITEPTTGRIAIEGRVGSLLEVGTGFHPELTGRENIYLNGAILGMSKIEIKSKFEEIVEFAEIERFLDTPVKRYSSGMYVRLAFSVAAHLDPEILIVDEVLAVGDAAFQKKCLGKMEGVRSSGRTVLFVSHNMTAIKDLCNRAVWLDAGRIVENGEANKVVSEYLHNNASMVLEQVWEDPGTAPGNEKVRLHFARLSVDGGSPFITVRTPLNLEFGCWNLVPGSNLVFSIQLHNLEGVCIFDSTSASDIYPDGFFKGVCHIPGDLLNDGIYKVMLMISKDVTYQIFKHEEVLCFEVQDGDREIDWYDRWPGMVRPRLKWSTEYLGRTLRGDTNCEPGMKQPGKCITDPVRK